MKYNSVKQVLDSSNTNEQKYEVLEYLIDGIIRESKDNTVAIEGNRIKHILGWLKPNSLQKKKSIPTCGHGDPGLNLEIAYCARCHTEGK